MRLKAPLEYNTLINTVSLSPYEEIERSIRDNGFYINEPLIIDDKIHRFDIEKKGNKRGWYVLHESNNFIYGMVGDFAKSEFCTKVYSKNCESLDRIERAKIDNSIKERLQEIEEERKIRRERVSERLEESLKEMPQATDINPYLVAKGIGEFAPYFKEKGRTLIIPLYNICYKKVKTAQLVELTENNTFKKTYVIGGEASGAYCIFGREYAKYNICYICEGMATGASIFRATNRMVVCAMSANNLKRAVKEVKEEYKGIYTVVVADNDESRTGEIKANESTADKVILVPLMVGFRNMDANDYERNGGDLKGLLESRVIENNSNTKIESDDEILNNMKPTEWLIKNWIPRESLVMIHGESGGGKTFVLRDMMLCVATGKEWHGEKVKKGVVLYLCGEGLQTVKERTLAWKLSNGVEELGEYSYTLPLCTDFDTQNGLLEIVKQIENAAIKPDLIAIDTVNRYMEGDENSAQQARSFINNCASLTERFNSTVVLIHHTGHSQSAQDRARGSSAWRGSLDTEISVHQLDHTITVKQTKQKGIELKESKRFFLQSFSLPLYDDDGEQVKSAILTEKESDDGTGYKTTDQGLNGRKRAITREELSDLIDGAFFIYGNELYGGSVSRKDLVQHFINNGYNSASVRAWLTPNGKRELNLKGILKYMRQGDCYVRE